MDTRKHKLPKIDLLGPTSLLIICAILLASLFIIDHKRKEYNNKLELIKISHYAKKEFLQLKEYTENIMYSMGEQIKKDPKNQEHINNSIQTYANYPSDNSFSWTLFSWLDENDMLTVDAQYGIMSKPMNLSNRDYLAPCKKKLNQFEIGQPVIGSTSKKWMIAGGYCIENQNKEYLGSIVVGLEIKTLIRKMRSVINDKYELYILDQDLNILTPKNKLITKKYSKFLKKYKNSKADSYFQDNKLATKVTNGYHILATSKN